MDPVIAIGKGIFFFAVLYPPSVISPLCASKFTANLSYIVFIFFLNLNIKNRKTKHEIYFIMKRKT
jgi:hypothetical protein